MSYFYLNGELYHHGIKGQRWGIRRFQNKDGSLTPEGRKRYDDDGDGTKANTTKKSNSKKAQDENDPEAEAARKAKIKKAVKVGAAVAGTALAAYGAYKMYDLYTGRKDEVDPATGFRLLKKDMSDMDHVNAINPGRIRFLSKTVKNKEIINGSSYNCMLCTTTYELRKRGFDVHAGYSTNGFTADGLLSKIYKNYEGTTKILPSAYDPKGTLEDITDFISKEGPGSRGNIMVNWRSGGGHSMIWENVNGKIKFMDGQTGVEYKDFANEVLKHSHNIRPIQMLRTDKLDINVSEMKKVINTDTLLKTYVDHGAEITARLATDPDVQMIAGTAVITAGYSAAAYKNHKEIKEYEQQTKKGGRKT